MLKYFRGAGLPRKLNAQIFIYNEHLRQRTVQRILPPLCKNSERTLAIISVNVQRQLPEFQPSSRLRHSDLAVHVAPSRTSIIRQGLPPRNAI